MKRGLILVLTLCLLLCGCGNDTAPETTVPDGTTAAQTTPETTQATAAPTTVPTTAPETTAPAAELPYSNPLTGEGLAEPMENRPFAVVINNIRQAQPLYGIGQADMLFEIVAEGGGSITRCLALYSDLSDVEKIGSVRSARTYLIELGMAYDAVFVHAGWSEYARDLLRSTGWDHLNGLDGSSVNYYYRDQARLDAGYALEHTLFTTGPGLIEYAGKKDIPITKEGGEDYGITFAADAAPNGETAMEVSLSFYKNGKKTTMTYDEAAGAYYGTQHWGSNTEPFADKNTGEKVPYENVFVLYAKTTTDGYRMFADLVGTGEGYFACGGKYVPITWSRANDESPFVYTLADGTPITQGIGKTYVAIVPTGSPVTFA